MKTPLTLTKSSLAIDGRKVAVDVTTLARHGKGHGSEMTPRLRCDKVVMRVNERLRSALGDDVPSGVTMLFTLTAPIRLAAQTAVAMEAKMRPLVARRTAEPHARFTSHGNHVQVQILRHGLKRAPALIGFVHNPGTEPRLLFDMTREMLDLVRLTARRRADARGLVVMTARHSRCLETYRDIYSQLGGANSARKILMVFSDGRAELLTP